MSALIRSAGLLAAGLVFLPSPSRAQWEGDPASSGATVYCEVINEGGSRQAAEMAAVKVMVQLLALGQGSLLIRQSSLPLAVEQRWLALIQARCPEIGAGAGAGHED